MKLAAHTILFDLGEVPLIGSPLTRGIIGLTEEGARLCREMAAHEVADADVPASCRELVEHLESGGYLEGSTSSSASRARIGSAYLHVTQRCNLSCKFCYSEGSDRNALPDPSLDELCHAIDLLGSMGSQRLVISGGEPFLRDDLPQIAAHAKTWETQQVIVLTNGLFATEENVAPLASAVDCIAVAFDGCSPASEAHLRGAKNFEVLVRAIETIKCAGIEARILPTIHARNLEDLPRYYELAKSLGASLSFSLLAAPAHVLGDYALSDEQLEALGVTALTSNVSYGDGAESGQGPSFACRRSCGAGTRTLSVAADGTVYPCHMLHDASLAMGNAFTDTAEDVLASDAARRLSALDVDSIEACSTCDKRYLCGGGCRARAFMSSGAIDGPDPYCKLSQSYYAELGCALRNRYVEKGSN